MNYIKSLLPVFPFAALVSAALYAFLYNVLKNKREKPSVFRIVSEYIMMGWIVMFIYVTQIMSFGNGFGSVYNIIPFKMFYIAFRYGSNNAGGVWQFLLNIVMFVPLGFLLPIVSTKKCCSYPKITAVSFFATLATELIQLITSRGTDIDDVIANTLGGVVGFALYIFAGGLFTVIKGRKNEIPFYSRKLIAGIAVCTVVSGTFYAVTVSDGSSKYGNLYYGHIKPDAIDCQCSIDDAETALPVYRYVDSKDTEKLKKALVTYSGISGDWSVTDSDGETIYTLINGTQAIIIYEHNKWMVTYEYGTDGENGENKIDESEALEKAWEYIAEFGISEGELAYLKNISEEWSDGNYHFIFTSTYSGTDYRIYGNVELGIGKDGRLIDIYDNRIKCVYCEDTICISQKDSIDILHDVGVGEWSGTAIITDVSISYTFIEGTGYLIPVWKYAGCLTADDGQCVVWEPIIDAVK